MQIQTVFKAGNSDVISIPADIKEKTGIKAGASVVLEVASDGKTILVSEAKNSQKNKITPEFTTWLNNFNKIYGVALKKLASK